MSSFYEFTLKLNRQITDGEAEALYEAGCGDAGIETGPRGTLASFERDAPSLAAAIASAVRDIEKVPGLRATGVACDHLVTLRDIAARAGVSREAARLWAAGQRGPGGFPPPMMVTTGGEGVWEWEQVSRWLQEHRGQAPASASARRRVMVAADAVLSARAALMSEPDETVRHELEQLLENA